MNKPVVQLTVQGYSQPIGIATYQALNKIPEPYKALAPVIDGVRRLLVEEKKRQEDKGAPWKMIKRQMKENGAQWGTTPLVLDLLGHDITFRGTRIK